MKGYIYKLISKKDRDYKFYIGSMFKIFYTVLYLYYINRCLLVK